MPGNIESSRPKRAHIIYRREGWALKKENASRASKIYKEKESAIADGEKLRENGIDVIVHREDGTIQDWKKSKK